MTNVSHQYYKKLQLFALTISNVTLVPVKSSMEMVKFLAHLVCYNIFASVLSMAYFSQSRIHQAF